MRARKEAVRSQLPWIEVGLLEEDGVADSAVPVAGPGRGAEEERRKAALLVVLTQSSTRRREKVQEKRRVVGSMTMRR